MPSNSSHLLRAIALGIFTVTTFSAYAAGGGVPAVHEMLPQKVRQQGFINVATVAPYPPNQFFEADGKTLTGISVDLGKALQEVMGVELRFVPVGFDSLVPGLMAGRYDTSISALNITPARTQQITMVEYVKTGGAFLVRKGNPHKVVKRDDACGLTLSAIKGSRFIETMEMISKNECVPAGKQPIKVALYNESSDSYTAVRSSRADITYLDYAVAKYVAARSNGELEVIETVYPDQPYGATFANNTHGTQLAKAFQASMNHIIKSGKYKLVLDKWGIGNNALDTSNVVFAPAK